jgi:hypothetical protein
MSLLENYSIVSQGEQVLLVRNTLPEPTVIAVVNCDQREQDLLREYLLMARATERNIGQWMTRARALDQETGLAEEGLGA